MVIGLKIFIVKVQLLLVQEKWDNRYMAAEEGAYGADLKATTFVKVSGGNFYPGMLVREIK